MPSSYDIWKTTPPDDKPGFSEAEDFLGKTIIDRDEDDDPRFTEIGEIVDFELLEEEDEDGKHCELFFQIEWQRIPRNSRSWIAKQDLKEYEVS